MLQQRVRENHGLPNWKSRETKPSLPHGQVQARNWGLEEPCAPVCGCCYWGTGDTRGKTREIDRRFQWLIWEVVARYRPHAVTLTRRREKSKECADMHIVQTFNNGTSLLSWQAGRTQLHSHDSLWCQMVVAGMQIWHLDCWRRENCAFEFSLVRLAVDGRSQEAFGMQKTLAQMVQQQQQHMGPGEAS